METTNKDSMSTDLNSLNINKENKELENEDYVANQEIEKQSTEMYNRQMMPDLNNPDNQDNPDLVEMNYQDMNNMLPTIKKETFMNKIIKNLKVPIIAIILFILFNFNIVDSLLIKYITYFSHDEKLNFVGLIFKAIIFGIMLFIINYFI